LAGAANGVSFSEVKMPADKPRTVIKKYANRRLYHTGTSAYVTLDDLAAMVRRGEDFVVQDARTGEDITRGVLAQIIFDAESRGEGLLPIAFLRQLITFYGGQMQSLVPTYLEHSLASFAREQEKLRKQLNDAWGKEAFDAVEDQVRRNMDMFQRSMRMFLPFTPEAEPAAQSPDRLAQDVAALRGELARMQEKIERLTGPEEDRDTPREPDPPRRPDGTE
jgi:polyhydroxyalkanoate synthesis repressor PhaR